MSNKDESVSPYGIDGEISFAVEWGAEGVLWFTFREGVGLETIYITKNGSDDFVVVGKGMDALQKLGALYGAIYRVLEIIPKKERELGFTE